MALGGSDLGRTVLGAVSSRRLCGAPVSGLRMIALALPVVLAGCSATESIGTNLLLGGAKPQEMDPAIYAKTAVCPTIEIREGAEFMPILEGGKGGAPGTIRFQAAVQRAARDCDETADGGIRVRVGVAGRVLSGPQGATGSLTVPVRVAVLLGDKVLYSKITTTSVDVQAPDYSALWAIVDDGVTLSAADSREATIYVGLDGKGDVGPKKTKPAKKSVTKG